jgi:hypothetical protein
MFLAPHHTENSSSPLGNAARGTSVRRAVWPGGYGLAAMTALAYWRTDLLKRTLQWYGDHNGEHLTLDAGINYEIFEPFVTCPPDQPFERIGAALGEGEALTALV